MVKPLSQKTKDRKRAYLKAIEDYFGERLPEPQFKKILAAVKSGDTRYLTDQEQADVWRIRTNLKDQTYLASFKA